MLHAGSLRKRSGPSGSLALVAAAWLGLVGCQRPALRPWEEQPHNHAHAADGPTTSSAVPPSPLPPVAEGARPLPKPAPTPPTDSSASATPLLDEAIARAESIERTIRTTRNEPEKAPTRVADDDGADPQPPAADPLPEFAVIELPAEARTLPVAVEVADKPTPAPAPEPTSAKVPAPDIAAASAPAPAPAPPKTWDGLIDELRDFAGREIREETGSGGVWHVRGQVLDWLAGDLDDPAWAGVIPVLAAPDADPSSRSQAIRRAVDAIEAGAPLAVDALKVCRRVHGFGHYETVEPTALHAGQALIVYCEISGLRYEAATDGFRSRLASRVELRRRGDAAAVWAHELGTAEDHCARRRRDFYVNYRVALPPTLAPGEYDLVILQNDLTGGRDASGTLAVAIVADPPAVASGTPAGPAPR